MIVVGNWFGCVVPWRAARESCPYPVEVTVAKQVATKSKSVASKGSAKSSSLGAKGKPSGPSKDRSKDRGPVKAPAKPAKALVKKMEVKKVLPKKPEPKKPIAKKPDIKKPDTKKPDLKKLDIKKAGTAKPEAKKLEAKKPVVAPKSVAPKSVPAKVELKPQPGKGMTKVGPGPGPGVGTSAGAATSGVTGAVKAGVKPGAIVDAKALANGPAKGPTNGLAKVEPKKAVVPLGKTDVKAPPKRMKPPVVPVMPAGIGRLLDPNNPIRKPLIPSGPRAAHVKPLGSRVTEAASGEPAVAVKTNLSPEQLEEFRQLLIKKRQQLIGDITGMESDALRSESGSLSNMPSQMGEQGSEAYDQSLSLNIAASERKLLREIEDALKRIADGTYGICELSLKPIKIERLRELPWARHSMEAARELERMSMRKF